MGRVCPKSRDWGRYALVMLKGEDIVLLLALTDEAPGWTVRSLERDTTVPRSVVQRSLVRLEQAGLLDPRRRAVNLSQTEEFLIHGLKYVFPASLGGESRGVPAAWGARPLREKLATGEDDRPPVWPSGLGSARGPALEPLHSSVVSASERDSVLGEQLALVDALRVGDARIRGLAAELLVERLETSRR